MSPTMQDPALGPSNENYLHVPEWQHRDLSTTITFSSMPEGATNNTQYVMLPKYREPLMPLRPWWRSLRLRWPVYRD